MKELNPITCDLTGELMKVQIRCQMCQMCQFVSWGLWERVWEMKWFGIPSIKTEQIVELMIVNY